ncbi:MAG: lysoplasmalogenase family protein [bacterium]|jgi:uncharacterized membrane protein YhhN
MEWTGIIIISAIAISAVIFFIARNKDRVFLQAIFRPLTTGIIILYAVIQNDLFSSYEYLLVSALILAAAGDLFVALPLKKKVLSQFLQSLAIIAMSVFCMQDPGPYFMWMTVLPVILGAIYFMLMMYRRAERYRVGLMIYILILANLLVQSSGRAWYIAEDGTGLLFAGALILVVSESFKAFYLYRKRKTLLFVAYLNLYWISLTLIALSI